MSDNIKRKASQTMRFIRRTNLPEFLAYSLSIAQFVIGLAILLAPSQRHEAFGPAWTFASPVAWAAALMGTALICGTAVLIQRSWAFVPFMIQTALWSMWAAFAIMALPSGGVPSAGAIYTFAAWGSLMVTAIYWGELDEKIKRGKRRAGALPWATGK